MQTKGFLRPEKCALHFLEIYKYWKSKYSWTPLKANLTRYYCFVYNKILDIDALVLLFFHAIPSWVLFCSKSRFHSTVFFVIAFPFSPSMSLSSDSSVWILGIPLRFLDHKLLAKFILWAMYPRFFPPVQSTFIWLFNKFHNTRAPIEVTSRRYCAWAVYGPQLLPL